jgi:quinol monooxygenase YgiN
MNSEFAMLVTFNTKPDQRQAFENALLDDLQHARTEPGNVSMDLLQARDEAGTYFFFERWKDRAALDSHFAQPYTKAVLDLAQSALTRPMEILYLRDLFPAAARTRPSAIDASSSVDLIVVFAVKEGARDAFIRQFEKSVKNSRLEPGCLLFHIHEVEGDPNAFVLYERWRDQAALDSHFAEPYTKELFELFAGVLARPVEERLTFVRELSPKSIGAR